MRYALFALLAACTSAPATDPMLAYEPGPWFVGEQHTMTVEWPPEVTCNNDGWDCQTGPIVNFQLDAVACNGCVTTGLELHRTVGNAISFQFAATTTADVSLDIDVSSGGVQRHFIAAGLGDQELALEASCEVVFDDYLDASVLPTTPCGPTRRSDQAIVIDWDIRTLRGTRIPFCPDNATICEPAYPRKVSMIELSPAPQVWRDTTPIYTSLAASTVAMTVPLADGSPSSATISIPPIQ